MPYDTNKPFLILDLDQTVICSEPLDEFNEKKYGDKKKLFEFQNMSDYYIVFSRPHLQEFLDYAFANFNVTIWTAATKDYALFIIEKIIINNKPERKLDFLFFSYHCDLCKKQKKGTKNLDILWDVHKLPGYTKKNTVILDDYKEDVHKIQPNNCIIAPPFEFFDKNSEKDTFLTELIPQLNLMKERINSNAENEQRNGSEEEIDLAKQVNINMHTVSKT
jgi:TFIIF-interacting CTD phosphatase-like protein